MKEREEVDDKGDVDHPRQCDHRSRDWIVLERTQRMRAGKHGRGRVRNALNFPCYARNAVGFRLNRGDIDAMVEEDH